MKKFTEYVLIHVRQKDLSGKLLDNIALVLKDRPDWQKGRLNLVGGHVEKGEAPMHAAMRELQEETGLIGNPMPLPSLCGHITGINCVVYCFVIDVLPNQELIPREGETEKVDWYNIKSINTDPRLMPNLQLIIPLMHLEYTGWSVTDLNSSSDTHQVSVSLSISKPFRNG